MTTKRLFYKETDGIFRLRVPFENLYTSVFFIKTPKADILVDTATKADDVDDVILPALKQLGFALSDMDLLVLTHRHSDHSGGLNRIAELSPNTKLITDVCPLADGVSTYRLAGHTEDCIGILDERTHTLISGDGLQGAGIGKYRCSLENKSAYLETVETVKADPRIENILFSHAYEPWCVDRAIGRSEVNECLSECIKYL